MEQKKLYYAAWWRRFGAFWIDMIVMLPFMIVQIKIINSSPRMYVATLIPFSLLCTGYWIYCHGRWGKTIGKKLTGTCVTNLDGSHISWKQAFLRSSVDIICVIISYFALIPTYLSIPIEGYAELASPERSKLIQSLWPAWHPYFLNAQQLWIWSEFIVILLNKRRRALHDFIAGTVVLQNKPSRRQARAEDPYSIDTFKEIKKMKL